RQPGVDRVPVAGRQHHVPGSRIHERPVQQHRRQRGQRLRRLREHPGKRHVPADDPAAGIARAVHADDLYVDDPAADVAWMSVGRRLSMTRARLPRRLEGDAGFGLVELLIAMSILTVAIGALVAVFGSSLAVLRHASAEGTALTLADRQLEAYRSMPFTCIPD